jgi:streptogramin lyase
MAPDLNIILRRVRPVWFAAALALLSTSSPAATLEVVAGSGEKGSDGDGGPALQAKFDNPFGLVRGPDGALWIADYGAHVIRRIDREGRISTVAGNGRAAYAGDGGPAREASLNHPHELQFGRDGHLYIADTSNHAIRRLDVKTGVITTWAGTGVAGNSGDGGPASKAQLKDPISLQFSPGGDLFIADVSSHVIRRVDARTGVISTAAGTGRAGPTPEGAPLQGTPLNGPRSLDFDAAGDLWLATREGNQVLRLDFKSAVIRHVAGTGAKGFGGNGGPARTATFSGPKGIDVVANGDVYLVDTENHAIRRIDGATGTIAMVAGTGAAPVAGSVVVGNPLEARLARPHGVFVDADGTVFIGDSENHRVVAVRAGAGR